MLSRGYWEREIGEPLLHFYIICVIPHICLASLCLKQDDLNQEAWTMIEFFFSNVLLLFSNPPPTFLQTPYKISLNPKP